MTLIKVSASGKDDLQTLKLVASATSLQVSISEQSDGEPTATKGNEVMKGLAPVARYIAESGGSTVSAHFLGNTVEEQALVSFAGRGVRHTERELHSRRC